MSTARRRLLGALAAVVAAAGVTVVVLTTTGSDDTSRPTASGDAVAQSAADPSGSTEAAALGPSDADQPTSHDSSTGSNVCVDQFGKQWPLPDTGPATFVDENGVEWVNATPAEVMERRYDDAGRLWMDECGNEYGADGNVVRTPDGVCVNGLAPGFEDQPERNVCFDPSLVPDAGDVPGADLQVGVEDGVLSGELTVG